MHIRDDHGKLVDSECSLDHFDGAPCIVVESSGGSVPARGIKGRNPDYNKLLGLLFNRLAASGNRISRVILDSSKVADLPVSDRVVDLEMPTPVDLGSIDTDQFRKLLQRKISQMHRSTGAKPGGNPQKRIRICLERPVDPDALMMHSESDAGQEEVPLAQHLTETQRSYLRAARIGQGVFRKQLLRLYRGTCPLTGIKHDQLLIASHIKPWKVATNAERLDPSNGILLSALVDRLFDKGLISFSPNGDLLVSRSVSPAERVRCGLDRWRKLRLPVGSAAYMNYHRELEFKRG